MKLIELPGMNTAIRIEKSNKIKLIHKFAFGNIGDYSNWKWLRSFSGFLVSTDSQELQNKIEQIKTDFQLNELISITNVLCIDNSGTHKDLILDLYLILTI